MDRTRMVGNVTNIVRVKDVLDCATFCLSSIADDCYSFNFGKTAINGLYTCEVSNSERRLDPASIQEVSDIKYYGFTAEVSG